MKTRNMRINKQKGLTVSVSQIKRRLDLREERGTAERVPTDNHTYDGRGGEIRQMMDFLKRKYMFRFNTVMGYTEYAVKNTQGVFMPLGPRETKRMTLEVQLSGIVVSIKDVRNFLESDLLRCFNPIRQFLDKCEGAWDGKDHIRQLAATLKCGNEHWADWFYRWFLGMVDQWRRPAGRQYGNSIVPLIISRQGFCKSTFCRRILPPELMWGYTDNMLFSEKKQVLQIMSQFLLVNLDEFNQISPKMQEGFLKNLLQLPSVKIKRPYGSHVEEMPRLASFVATSNVATPLCDPTGSRRFIAVELTEPIDVSRDIDYKQLYAQALAALNSGERAYFNQEETRLIMESNRRFEEKSPMEMCFNSMYRPAATNGEGTYMTTSEIFKELKSVYGSIFAAKSLAAFGRRLRAIPELKYRMSSRGTEYLVERTDGAK